jgi:roadblock/LC7 domain-containing protein
MDTFRPWRRVAFVLMTLVLAGAPLRGQGQQFSENSSTATEGLESRGTGEPKKLSFPAPSQERNYSSPPDPGDDLELTWKKVPRKFLADEKYMWLFPTQLAKGRHWLPTAIIVGGTGVFIKEDPPLMRKVRGTDIFDGFNHLKSTVSGGIITAVPAGFYAISLLRKDSYGQSTCLLAGEAVANDFVLMSAMKISTRRIRPAAFPPNSSYNDSFFRAGYNPVWGKGSSFPSGHAMMAFSVATVFSQRYKQHKWVPYVAYAVATALSFSRVTTGAHFASDTFIGAAMGFAIARYDVLRRPE